MKSKNSMKSFDLVKVSRKQNHLTETLKPVLTMFGSENAKSPVEEFKFHPERKWRFDFAWPENMLAVECDGGQFTAMGGRHNSDADREKINTASSLGWTVLRFSGNQIKSDPMGCLKLIEDVLKMKSEVKK